MTYHSNAIEGCTLSLRETQLVIEDYAPTSGKTLREIYEASNHYRAVHGIEEWVDARPLPLPLTEQDILEVHADILADIAPKFAGRLRTDRVLIKGTRFIPPGSHKFLFVAIHPFADCNGRIARLLMNYHLLRHGYLHAIIEVEHRADYLTAFEEANVGRCERFARLVLQTVERSIGRLIT